MPSSAYPTYSISLVSMENLKPATAVVMAVAHKAYKDLSVAQLTGLMNSNPVLVDVKGVYKQDALELAGIRVWRL